MCECLKDYQYKNVTHTHTHTHTHTQAIEEQDTPTLKQAIKELKTAGGGLVVLLDTCRLIRKSGVAYSVSLLALCGFHGRKDMVDLLLKEGAGNKATRYFT